MSFQGKFLVARPILKDPVFGGKVVFITRSDKNGSEGFILNGPQCGRVGFGEMKGEEVPQDREQMTKMVNEGKIDSAPLYSGGPCQSPSIVMFHGYPDFIESADKDEFQIGSTLLDEVSGDKTIIPGVYYGEPSTMAQIIMGKRVVEGKFRFFNNQAAWSAGQLEREIEAGAWDVVEADIEAVFDPAKADKIWSEKYNYQAKDFIKDMLQNDDDLPPFRMPEPSDN